MLKEGICIRLKSKNRKRITCQYLQGHRLKYKMHHNPVLKKAKKVPTYGK